jgi:uncharacterized protein involved in outer membrane biogenesis
VKNPPIFPRGYIVQVARIDAELSVGALLHRQVAIKSLVLEDPVVNLTSDPDGPWNFENPQAKVSNDTFPLGVISRVQIKQGQLIASALLPSDAAGPIFFEAHELSCELEQVNLAGIIDPSSSSMDGQGSLKAGLLRFGWVEARNLESKFRLEARHVFFTDVKAEVYDGSAAGDLTFDLSGKNTSFMTNARGKDDREDGRRRKIGGRNHPLATPAGGNAWSRTRDGAQRPAAESQAQREFDETGALQ